jgi:hypothetical protein
MEIMKDYKCTECGNVKKVMINHDGLPVIWERCTEECMWSGKGEHGEALMSKELTKKEFDGRITTYRVKTGFHKRKFVRI